jgi:hypothetical protein
LEARRCSLRGKTQQFAAKEFPAVIGQGLFAKTEDKLRARLVAVDRFGREIDVGRANNLRLCTVL